MTPSMSTKYLARMGGMSRSLPGVGFPGLTTSTCASPGLGAGCRAPAPCSSPGLHDPMRTVCRQNGRILPACFSPPVCLAIDDHSCFIYAICDGNNSPHLNYRHCHRRQRCTFHRAIGARQGVRHWRRRRRGSPLITRALPSPTPCFTQVEITIVSSARGPGKAS